MSTTENELLRNVNEKIELIEPSTGKLFFEHKTELVFVKPRLMPLKSQALQCLEEMHRGTARHLQQKRSKSHNNNSKNNNNNNIKENGAEVLPAAVSSLSIL